MCFYFPRSLGISGRICFTTQRLSRSTAQSCFVCQCPQLSSARPLTHRRHNLQPTSTHQAHIRHQCISSKVHKRRMPSAFPVVEGAFQLSHRHVFESNLQNSQACQQRYDLWLFFFFYISSMPFLRHSVPSV